MITLTLFSHGTSLGLGVGKDGACHLIELPLGLLLPRDCESGWVHPDSYVLVRDYNTHVTFSVVDNNGSTLLDERACYTSRVYEELAFVLKTAFNPEQVEKESVVEEDEALDERLEELRMHAIKSLDNELDEDEDDFYDEEEVASIDEDIEDVEEEEEEATIITLTQPSSKLGSKKWKKDIQDMIAVLLEYYDEDALDEDGLDVATLAEVLDTVFEEVDELNIDTSVELLPQFADYVEFE